MSRFKNNPNYEKRVSSNGAYRWFKKSFPASGKSNTSSPRSDIVRNHDHITDVYRRKIPSSYMREKRSKIKSTYNRSNDQFMLQCMRANSFDDLPQEYTQLLLEYYSTPVGYSQLKNYGEVSYNKNYDEDGDLIFMPDPSIDFYIKHKDMLEKVDNYRASQLSELSSKPDIDHEKPDFPFQTEFQSRNEIRRAKEYGKYHYDDEYVALSDYMVHNLSEEQFQALHWYAGSGSVSMNMYLIGSETKEKAIRGDADVRDNMTEERFDNSISAIQEIIEENPLDEPVVLYRGVDTEQLQYMFGDDVTPLNIHEKISPSHKVTLDAFSSASSDPGIAESFARSNVILEIKTKNAFPSGSARNGKINESEFIIDNDTHYSIVDVQTDVQYEMHSIKGVIDARYTHTVIQLEEIE